MKVSFIIPLYNCLSLTQAMLASLQATLPAGLEHEIIFVDDGSTDGTRAWLATLPAPACSMLNETNRGFSGACNRGAASAQGEFLFFLNNDLVLLPHWLEPMLAALVRFPASGLIGNVHLNATTGAVDHAGVFFNHKGKPEHETALPLSSRWFGLPAHRPVAALTGACFGVRRTRWEQLGGFDEAFVNGCEDIDLCLRAKMAGLQNRVALRSVIRHHVSSSAGRKLRDEQNTYRLVQRWHDSIAELTSRDWCRQQIIRHADQSRDFDYLMLRDALAYLLLLPAPPRRVRQGVAEAMAHERQRWSEILDGAPPFTAPAGQRTDQI